MKEYEHTVMYMVYTVIKDSLNNPAEYVIISA